jgi:hypothetical protein
VSHSSINEEFVNQIQELENGETILFDLENKSKLPNVYSQKIEESIKNRIENANVILILMTEEAYKSEYVRQEIPWIEDKIKKCPSIPVIPVIDKSIERQVIKDYLFIKKYKYEVRYPGNETEIVNRVSKRIYESIIKREHHEKEVFLKNNNTLKKRNIELQSKITSRDTLLIMSALAMIFVAILFEKE